MGLDAGLRFWQVQLLAALTLFVSNALPNVAGMEMCIRDSYDLSYAGGRPLFATVGSFENRKGQDIFCKAIRLLPPETMKKASFLFVGKAAEPEMMDACLLYTSRCV